MIARLVFIAALAAAPMAAAQTPPPVIATELPASPEEIADASAYADKLIGAADASAFFVNKTDSAVPEVQHVASGMRCVFSKNDSARILIFPARNDSIPLGYDVGCSSREDSLAVETTSYATRYRPLPSEDAVVANSVNAIRNRWPDAISFDGSLAIVGQEGQQPEYAAFKVMTPDGPMLTMVLVEHIGEWGFKVRATGPFDDAMLVSVVGGLIMSNIQRAANAD